MQPPLFCWYLHYSIQLSFIESKFLITEFYLKNGETSTRPLLVVTYKSWLHPSIFFCLSEVGSCLSSSPYVKSLSPATFWGASFWPLVFTILSFQGRPRAFSCFLALSVSERSSTIPALHHPKPPVHHLIHLARGPFHPPRVSNTSFLAANNNHRFWGTDIHPSCFAFSCKHLWYVLKVLASRPKEPRYLWRAKTKPWGHSWPWLRLQIPSMKINNRIGQTRQPWRSPTLSGETLHLIQRMQAALTLYRGWMATELPGDLDIGPPQI